MDTFLQLLVKELLELDEGVQAFDGNTKSMFQLRDWVTIVTGDGPTLADAIGMKISENTYKFYQTCMIRVEHGNSPNKTYYIPHTSYNFMNPLICTKLCEDIYLVKKTRSDNYH